MPSLLLSKTDIGLKHFFAHNVRYGNSVTFRIWVALEFLQYLDIMSLNVLIFVLNARQLIELVSYIITRLNNVYLRRNKQFSKWCVSKVFQYIYVRGLDSAVVKSLACHHRISLSKWANLDNSITSQLSSADIFRSIP